MYEFDFIVVVVSDVLGGYYFVDGIDVYEVVCYIN